MTVLLIIRDAMASVVKTTLLNDINLCCLNYSSYQYCLTIITIVIMVLIIITQHSTFNAVNPLLFHYC